MWCLALGPFIVAPLGPSCLEVGPPLIRPALHVLQMLDQIEIWQIWRPGQSLVPFIVFLERFQSSVCGVSGHIILLGGATAIE